MKNPLSAFTLGIVCIVMLAYRVNYSGLTAGSPPLKITEWDALGYYLYLPSILKYHDYHQLKWLPEIDKKYAVSGGNGFQAMKLDNGNYVFKYLGGIALLELPFFYIGDWTAKYTGYPPDGFSPPYQYAISFGAMLYCFLALCLLCGILRRYYSDITVAITLAAVALATNFIEYAVIENGQSHGFIFPLYVLVLYTTIKWHERPRAIWSCLTGLVIGIATSSRPTEAIMLFIPLMWGTQNKDAATKKWQLVKQHKVQVAFAAIFGIVGVLPQLIYWKLATGSFIFDVGSSWDFLTPHFRVLWGWEKGWFIYTPITIFFIAGMFFIRLFPFNKSVLWFCLLNIYIIISWREWRYGGSYSTRALMQSYPVFALAFAAFAEKMMTTRWRWLFYMAVLYLIAVNLFQIVQYRREVIHYDDMNRRYYGRIYLNLHPSPLDMSFLDSNEAPPDQTKYTERILAKISSDTSLHIPAWSRATLWEENIDTLPDKEMWLRVESEIYAPGSLWQTYLYADMQKGDSVKHSRVRLFSALSKDSMVNHYDFYVKMPQYFSNGRLRLYIESPFTFNGAVKKITLTAYK